MFTHLVFFFKAKEIFYYIRLIEILIYDSLIIFTSFIPTFPLYEISLIDYKMVSSCDNNLAIIFEEENNLIKDNF